jgi:hypothetical protein
MISTIEFLKRWLKQRFFVTRIEYFAVGYPVIKRRRAVIALAFY